MVHLPPQPFQCQHADAASGCSQVDSRWGPDAVAAEAEAEDALGGKWKAWVYFPNTNQLRKLKTTGLVFLFSTVFQNVMSVRGC